MKQPLNILVMNRQFGGIFGGVEYMSTSLVNAMVQRGHNCHLLSLDTEEAEMEYDLYPSITWHKVSTVSAQGKASWKERWCRLLKIRNILKKEKIDIAIGFQDGVYLSLAVSALGLGIPVVAAERNAPTRFDFIKEGKYRQLRYNSFRLAAAVTVQCPSYVDLYPSYLRERMNVIPNPVFPAKISDNPHNATDQRKQLLTVGRLSYQKNFEVLVSAFSRIANDFPDWDLIIVGEGDRRRELERLIEDKGLEQRVKLEGYVKDPASHYGQADLFCLPSRWEGFPNVLAEAMSYSIPCVGFSGCAGVNDLIGNDAGVLAEGQENEDTLSMALSSLMLDEKLRNKLGENAGKKVKAFEPQFVFDAWEKLFLELKKA